jgi:hypothetical protein
MSRAWNEPLWRLDYVIRSRNIRHAFKAGGSLRMYDAAAVERIRKALSEIRIRGYGRPIDPRIEVRS